MDIQSAVKLARDGLEMGYRVIASRLNAIPEVKRLELQFQCAAVRNGDSMGLASHLIRDAWHCLGSRVPRVEIIAPWTILSDVEAGGDIESSFRVLERITDWTKDTWRTRVISPFQEHHKNFLANLDSVALTAAEFSQPLAKSDVCDLYGIHRTTLCNWIKSGKILCSDNQKRTLRLPMDEYQRLLSIKENR